MSFPTEQKLPKRAKPLFEWVLKLLVSKAGPLIKTLVASIAVFVFNIFREKLGVDLDEETKRYFVGFVLGVVYYAIDYAVVKYELPFKKALQEQIGVVDDGLIGAVTLEAGTKMAKKPTEILP